MQINKLASGKILLTLSYPILIYLGLTYFQKEDHFFSFFVLFIPTIINLILLSIFLKTLIIPPSFAEKFAMFWVINLSKEEILYCRKVTKIWCIFFAFNGSIAAWLSLYGSLGAWTLYNGLIAYILIGTLFTFEFLYRHWRFRRYVGTVFDPLLSRLFPPSHTNEC